MGDKCHAASADRLQLVPALEGKRGFVSSVIALCIARCTALYVVYTRGTRPRVKANELTREFLDVLQR